MANNREPVPTPREIVTEVKEETLLPPLGRLAAEYDDRIGIRDEYLWKWLARSFRFVTLDSVPDERVERVCTHKSILSMYVTLVDDLADRFRDEASFREASKIPFEQERTDFERPDVRTEYLRFLQEVWDTTESLLDMAERESEFRPFFEFDLRQALNAMDYERLANDRPEMMNTTEMLQYAPHNMVMLAAADIDMMYSPSIDRDELSRIRETVHRGQKLVRISNWASTWEREIEEGDVTSAMFTEAIARGLLTRRDLERLRDGDGPDSETLVARFEEQGLEEQLLDRWDLEYSKLNSEVPSADSVDLEAFIEGISTVRAYHVASKGYK